MILRNNDVHNELYKKLIDFIDNSNIDFKTPIKDLIKKYFSNKIKYSTLRNWLEGFYNLQFHQNIKVGEIKAITKTNFKEILEEKYIRKDFLNSFFSLFNMVLILLAYFVENPKMQSKRRKEAVIKLFNDLKVLYRDLLKKDNLLLLSETDLASFDLIYLGTLFNAFLDYLNKTFPKYKKVKKK